jgi:hypothetical protein
VCCDASQIQFAQQPSKFIRGHIGFEGSDRAHLNRAKPNLTDTLKCGSYSIRGLCELTQRVKLERLPGH